MLRISIALALTGAVVALSACGGSDAERQDVDEPSGEFPVEVVDAVLSAARQPTSTD